MATRSPAQRSTLRNALRATAAVLLAALAVLSWNQIGTWRNQVALYQHAIRVTQNNFVAHNNLGNTYETRDDLDRAEKHFLEAIRIKPDHANAVCNLGIVYYRRGQFPGGSGP